MHKNINDSVKKCIPSGFKWNQRTQRALPSDKRGQVCGACPKWLSWSSSIRNQFDLLNRNASRKERSKSCASESLLAEGVLFTSKMPKDVWNEWIFWHWLRCNTRSGPRCAFSSVERSRRVPAVLVILVCISSSKRRYFYHTDRLCWCHTILPKTYGLL